MVEHSYATKTGPKLVKINDSCSLEEDPAGWTNRRFSLKEIKSAVRLLKAGKACGWDNIPNSFIMNAPEEVLVAITALFNRMKEEGVIPHGWNKGRVTLIFKKGLREALGNYRPVTVIISLSGLYSRVLNGRLTEVVEAHGLLGEEQNGFRKGRRMSDNNFLLDSVLWKSRNLRQKVHLAYLDISKAYDSVLRPILWEKLSSMGWGSLASSYSR